MENTLISTVYGEVQGVRENGTVIWRGIPYAQPPVGDLRFQPPQSLQAWEGARDATRFGPVSPQSDSELENSYPDGMRPVKSEDCLYLNIWAADGPARETPLPVMVWIHGGAFMNGAGSLPFYDGTSFVLNSEVIVVTINYRLGVFGFLDLSHHGQSESANLGLQDQIAALQWVQDNIAAFGGDPDRVTIFGESAGAMSIAALLAMPASKGLFRAAILQSGASQFTTPDVSRTVTEHLIASLGGSHGDTSVLYQASTEQLLSAGEQVRSGAGALSMPFQPVLHESTLPIEPLQAIRNGAAKGIPLIIGTNMDEGSMFVHISSELMSKPQIAGVLESMTGLNAAPLIEQYPMTAEGQAQIMTDLFFWRSAIQYAEAQLEHGDVWMYRFDWNQSGHQFFNTATHASEIPFVFNNQLLLQHMGVELDEQTLNMATQMQRAWATFAHTAIPTTLEIPWTDYNRHERNTLVFNRIIELVQDPDAEKRIQFIGE
ncbi:carboxylesterase/lipase family protein [Paenibacillus sp. WLX1005]|uniref:carboxylesterase/lipase family protein n=1 Tax=Paenibacillus sp. WLX1005 TaxID=3243766 RepID=UPI0039841C98